MLVDVALSAKEKAFIQPCPDGSSVLRLPDAVIRRAYCDLVMQEAEQRMAARGIASVHEYQIPAQLGVKLAQGGLKQ